MEILPVNDKHYTFFIENQEEYDFIADKEGFPDLKKLNEIMESVPELNKVSLDDSYCTLSKNDETGSMVLSVSLCEENDLEREIKELENDIRVEQQENEDNTYILSLSLHLIAAKRRYIEKYGYDINDIPQKEVFTRIYCLESLDDAISFVKIVPDCNDIYKYQDEYFAVCRGGKAKLDSYVSVLEFVKCTDIKTYNSSKDNVKEVSVLMEHGSALNVNFLRQL